MLEKNKRIKAIIDNVLQKTAGRGVAAEVTYSAENRLTTRFGENSITQNTCGVEEKIRVTVSIGKKSGSSVTNRLDEGAIEKMVDRAQQIAQTSPEDPEFQECVGPQEYPVIPQRYHTSVMDLQPQDLATSVKSIIDVALQAEYKASGLLQSNYRIDAMATSNGMEIYDHSTWYDGSSTMHGPSGSGHSSIGGLSTAQLDFEKMAQQALSNARAAQNPVAIDPGTYTVIFEPSAVESLLPFFVFSMRAREADEGSTAFTNLQGQKLFSDKFNLVTKIDDPHIPACPFGEDGLAAKPTTWVENGVLQRLKYDRYWAQQKGTTVDPGIYPLFIRGEERSLDDLVASCKRGLLVKRLWYIRYVDQKQLLLTGMTRDGLFLIEDGQIKQPLKNLRFNDSPIKFFNNIEGLSRPEYGESTQVPGILSTDFTFSSTTESI